MTRTFGLLFAAALIAGLGCGSDKPAPDPDGEQPGDYSDPLIERSRMPGSTFIEIQEVRVRDDGLVLFCTGVQGLRIADGTDPDNIRVRDPFTFSMGNPNFPRCQHLAFDGDIAYATNKGDEIQPTPFVSAADISGDPAEVATYTRAGVSFEGIAAGAGLVYVAMHADGLAILRQNGAGFDELGDVDGLTNAWGVALDGTTVYVADGSAGLAIIDAADPASATVVGRVETGGNAQSVVVRDGVAFVGAGSVGLVTIDVADPASPTVMATIDTPGTALQVSLSGEHAYVADWNDVRVFDVSSPSSPVSLQTETVETREPFSRVLGVGAQGTIAFAGEWTGLHAYELRAQFTAPDLGVANASIEFGNTEDGEKDAIAVIVRNDGAERLVAFDISTSSPKFSVEPSRISLDPGERGVLEVVYTSSGEADFGELIIWSDDPDEEERKVAIVGNRAGIGVGDLAEPVRVRLLGGGEFDTTSAAGKVIVIAYFATF